MCKAIVIANEHNSTRRMLEKPLANAGIEVVAWVSFVDLHQADPKDAEVVVVNPVGINGNDHRIGAVARKWGLGAVRVPAHSKGKVFDMSELFRWQGARNERKAVKPEPEPVVEVAPPSATKGPPCVVCGKPVTRRNVGRPPTWAKTCSPECLRALRIKNAKLGNLKQKQQAAKTVVTPPPPVDPPAQAPIEVSEVNHRAPIVPLSIDSLVAVGAERMIPEDVLGERLGYAKSRTFHELIERNRADIEARFGRIQQRRVARSYESRPGITQTREIEENLLTKKQALYVTTKAGTSNAKDVVQELVEVYDAVTSGPQVTDDDSLVTILAKATDAKFAKLSETIKRNEKLTEEVIEEQERIEREYKARITAVETAVENVGVAAKPMVQQGLPRRDVLGTSGKDDLFDVVAGFALDCARKIQREDWDSSPWRARLLWCYAYTHNIIRRQVGSRNWVLASWQDAENAKSVLHEASKAVVVKRCSRAIPECYLSDEKTASFARFIKFVRAA